MLENVLISKNNDCICTAKPSNPYLPKVNACIQCVGIYIKYYFELIVYLA